MIILFFMWLFEFIKDAKNLSKENFKLVRKEKKIINEHSDSGWGKSFIFIVSMILLTISICCNNDLITTYATVTFYRLFCFNCLLIFVQAFLIYKFRLIQIKK